MKELITLLSYISLALAAGWASTFLFNRVNAWTFMVSCCAAYVAMAGVFVFLFYAQFPNKHLINGQEYLQTMLQKMLVLSLFGLPGPLYRKRVMKTK